MFRRSKKGALVSPWLWVALGASCTLNYGCNQSDISTLGATTAQSMPKIFDLMGPSYGVLYSIDDDDDFDL